jgi:mannose-6-phosphate isomerase class I
MLQLQEALSFAISYFTETWNVPFIKSREDMNRNFRKSSQFVMPPQKPVTKSDSYDIYPAFPLQHGKVYRGMQSLVKLIESYPVVVIDGYIGILWNELKREMDAALLTIGLKATWIDLSLALKLPSEIETMVEPFLGGDDPLFGTRTSLSLSDFFDSGKLKKARDCAEGDLLIFYGTGAFLAGVDGMTIYLDLPKNEIQYRARAGSITNLGCLEPDDPKKMYKRFYFVDWVVLNRHKEQFIGRVDVFADCQRPGDISWAHGDHVRATLDAMSENYFRVRPWFEPGVWGGDWIRNQINGLNQNVPNYAWSFELIVPENGLLFEQGNNMMELSFDWLMYRASAKVLGNCHDIFGHDFPIRFDFLDTFGGGNLSIQCHPRKDYMKKNFNENFTQEETYYILDATDDATVYLGFADDIQPEPFRQALEESFTNAVPLDVERFIQKHPSKKHDLFLIPPGTIHGSGINNLVLEISSTPYIFTFKLYDWLRPDLDGKPRPLNISRGMNNLCFDRCGEHVTKNFISVPLLLGKGDNWALWHLPTHADHLYDIHRYEFTGEITVKNDGKCHVLSLVEGTFVILETASGMRQQFSYAETFVIPAAASSYRLINNFPDRAILVKAFVK